MHRTPEPELMNDPHQVEAYADADFSGSDAAFLQRFERLCAEHQWEPKTAELLVDLGCGPGNISERLAWAFPAAQVMGIDAAEAMLAVARRRQRAVANPSPRVLYAQATLESLATDGLVRAQQPAGSRAVRGLAVAVLSNSLLHHLHHPQQLWDAIRRIAAPGALVLHRDLRRPETPQAALILREKHLSAAPEVLRRDYLASLHAAFSLDEVRQQLEAAGLEGLQVVSVEDRYLDVVGRLPV